MENQINKNNYGTITFLYLAVVVFVTFYVFLPILQFDFINYDDENYVYLNSAIQSFSQWYRWFSELYVTTYVPIPLFSYALDYTLYGMNPAGFHFTNLLIHSLNALLVFAILKLFLKSGFLALLGSLVFAVHPVQVEAVVWISQRKTLFCSFFILAGFWVYASDLQNVLIKKSKRLIVFLCFAFAFLSKVTAVMIPFVCVLYHYFYGRNDSQRAHKIFFLFFIPAILIAIITVVQFPYLFVRVPWNDLDQVFVREFSKLFFYISLVLNPTQLSIHYQPSDYVMKFHYAIFFAVSVMGFLLVSFRNKIEIGFWAAWVIIFLLPVINLFEIPIGDRHLYLPLLGIVVSAICLVKKNKWICAVIFIASACLFIPVTQARLSVWENSETYWKSAPFEGHRGEKSMMQLAAYYEDKGRLKEAKELYLKIVYEGHFPIVYSYLNLFNLLVQEGESAVSERERLKETFNVNYNEHFDLEKLYSYLLANRNNPKVVYKTVERVLETRK